MSGIAKFTPEELAQLAADDAELDESPKGKPKTRSNRPVNKTEHNKRYYAEHRYERSEYQKEYRQTHKAQVLAQRKKWRTEHPDYQKQYWAKKKSRQRNGNSISGVSENVLT